MLHGDFTRYSYNSGFWEEESLDEWLLCFLTLTVTLTLTLTFTPTLTLHPHPAC